MRQHAAHQLARLSLVQVLGQRHVRHHGVMLHFVQLAQGFLPLHIAGDAKGYRHVENILLVKGQPVLHPVTKAVDHLFAVADKRLHDATIVKSVVLLRQRQRHIEVVEADHRLDTAGDQIVDKTVVKGDTLVVKIAVTLRADAAPGDLEAVAVHAQILHQVEIFPVAVVGVGGHFPVRDIFTGFANVVHRHPLSALIPGPFRLHARHRVAP